MEIMPNFVKDTMKWRVEMKGMPERPEPFSWMHSWQLFLGEPHVGTDLLL